MELVTGRAGSPHITSQQDRQKHQGIWGTGVYILNTGNNLEAVVQSSNNIQIKDGALMSQGALFSVKVGTVDEVTIANGSQGMMRKDVIVARYTYNQGANTENAEWAVVQGTPAASNPQIPQITEGDIQAGDATVDTSVFIVTLDGINITSVDVVPELAPDIAKLKALIDELNGKSTYNFIETVWTNPTYSILKKGGIVYIDYYCTVQGGVGGTAFYVARLPQEVVPPRRIRSAAWAADGNSIRKAANVDIQTGGVVQFIAGGDFVEAGFSIAYPL